MDKVVQKRLDILGGLIYTYLGIYAPKSTQFYTMNPLNVVFVDVLGLAFDGNTINHHGLGGSESAMCLLAKELVSLGMEVTVYNSCKDSRANPGIYEGVKYYDLSNLEDPLLPPPEPADVFIGSRSVRPFYEPRFAPLIGHKTHKVLWMHDTFCDGDPMIEDLVVSGRIDEIFTLSDFHTTYVSFCDHGKRRNPEVLKSKMFMTRNGIKRYIDEVDISAKDSNLFVYNASVTKGMIPLVTKIWPKVKARIPGAKLKVIGGYYRFRDNANPDAQEIQWRGFANDPALAALGIEFTGIIPQKDIATILANASFMLYPGAFPETYGISTLESLAYNTPPITTRFGALEETAVALASYLIDYAIEPNVLYPHIDTEKQIERFVEMAIYAHRTPYIAAQKRQYCNIIRDICGWDGVALQWKQHFYSKLGLYLPVDEYRKVQHLNQRVHTVFGRRFSNPEEWAVTPAPKQEKIFVLSPFYNGALYIEDCIRSVAAQDYDNYHHVLIDDASTDGGYRVAKNTIASLPKNIRDRFLLVRNTTNIGSVANYVTRGLFGKRIIDDPIIVMLDGDDALMHRNDIFQMYNRLYNEGAEFTYGSCWSMIDNIPLVGQPYPKAVRDARSYRTHKFAWNMPYTHLRTFRHRLLEDVPESAYKDSKGNWLRAGGDTAIFYNAIEHANPDKIVVVQDIVCRYNDKNPINDYKVNGEQQTKTANFVLNQAPGKPKELFSVVIPTMWKYPPFLDFLRVLNDHPWVGEIIIIDNAYQDRPGLVNLDKVTLLAKDHNIFVNPAWNWGVDKAKNNRVCILNDDLAFDSELFQKMDAIYNTTNFGTAGLCPGVEFWGQPPITDGAIDIIPWTGQGIHGFGCLMFVDKRNWVPIPDGMNLYWGDNFIFDNHSKMGKQNYLITNMKHETPFAATVTKIGSIEGIIEKEKAVYDTIKLPIYPSTPTTVAPTTTTMPPTITTAPRTIATDPPRRKRVLLGVPYNKYVEPETYKSIYDLDIPASIDVEFQQFYGYNIEQIRNLIAHWAVNYDYLFAVDSDIELPKDALTRLLAHDKDIVSGVYIQRKPGFEIVEAYKSTPSGGQVTIPWTELQPPGLYEVVGCGFGCVLVKSEVLRKVGYPQFEYHMNPNLTIKQSEDVDFCTKARAKGAKVFVDSSIVCNHFGKGSFRPSDPKPKTAPPKPIGPPPVELREGEIVHIPSIKEEITTRLLALSKNNTLMPRDHIQYLETMGITPKVIYDIGASTLHWTNAAKKIWPNAEYVLFEAVSALEFLYKQDHYRYHIGVLGDVVGKTVDFYQSETDPAGSSYFPENPQFSPNAPDIYFPISLKTETLNNLIRKKNFPLPDLIKMDVQGAELDVLRGASKALVHCTDLILELQTANYNLGAPKADEVIVYLESIGFKLKTPLFSKNGDIDGDYHFQKY